VTWAPGRHVCQAPGGGETDQEDLIISKGTVFILGGQRELPKKKKKVRTMPDRKKLCPVLGKRPLGGERKRGEYTQIGERRAAFVGV